MNKTEIQQKLGELRTQATDALDAITNNTDDSRTAELEARHDAIMAEFDQLKARHDRLEAHESRMAAANQIAEQIEQRTREGNRPGSQIVVPGAGGEGEQLTYRAAFAQLARAGFRPDDLSEEARNVIKAGVAEFRSQTTSSTAGGYTVPTELATAVDKAMKAWGPMYDEAICTVIATSGGNPIDFPTVDDTATAVAKHTEGAAMTDDGGVDVVFGKTTLNAYAYDTEWVQVSMELLQDSAIDIEALIGELLGERLARRVNTELTTGDGSGDPSGIVTASSMGKTAASATAIVSDELIDLMHSLDPAYRSSPKARWMMNDTTLAAVRKLKASGTGEYIWQMGDIRGNAPATLLGHAYSINQAMASIATGQRTVLFGDFSKYYVRKAGSPVIGVRRETYWPNIGLAGIVRLDGRLLQSGAVKHLIQA